MSTKVVLQLASPGASVPGVSQFQRWVVATTASRREAAEVTVRVVDEDESRALNQRYRHKDRPTNVLAFPADIPAFVGEPALGDIVICRPVVVREALDQDKPEEAHWAHMVVHGTLHLLGYDHQDDTQARQMETLEVQILRGLGYADPYRIPAGAAPSAVRAEDGTP